MTLPVRIFTSRCALSVLLSVALTVQVSAATWHVPADYATIQSAINGTAPGDTVVVSSGTYFENLTLRSDLVLVAAFVPSSTVIDGAALATVITAASVSNCLVSGFTIQNGRGSGGDVGHHGGGLELFDCGPTLVISNNIIRNNIAWDGAGIHIWFGTGATIENNIFENNESQGQSSNAWGTGGGIMMDGPVSLHPVVRGNLFKGNHSDRGWVSHRLLQPSRADHRQKCLPMEHMLGHVPALCRGRSVWKRQWRRNVEHDYTEQRRLWCLVRPWVTSFHF